MKKYSLISFLVYGGLFVMLVATSLGFPKVAVIFGGLPSLTGMLMQIYEVHKSYSIWRKSMAEREQAHQELMQRVRELPPNEAIELLLSTRS